jgi:hypothetical protein
MPLSTRHPVHTSEYNRMYNIDEFNVNIQTVLDIIHTWFKENFLSLNFEEEEDERKKNNNSFYSL